MRIMRARDMSAKVLDDAVKTGEVIGLRIGWNPEPAVLILPLEQWRAAAVERYGAPVFTRFLHTATGAGGLSTANLLRVIEEDDGATRLTLGTDSGLPGLYGAKHPVAAMVPADAYWRAALGEEGGDV